VELAALGHSFRSQSDTEVMLAAYAEWGAACVRRFNGMFAFALYDREAGRLLVARDRFGVKPLYYWVSPAGFVAFGSEIKQFTVLPGWSARLNGQRGYDFLNWRITDHTHETLFQGVYQLRGGEMLELDVAGFPAAPGASLAPRPWYELVARPFTGSFEDAAGQFRDLLTDAVRLRLRADVPVGTCLSGGLDSSSIVCAMDQLLRGTPGAVQKTFSACAAEPRFDEREWVDEVVRHTRVEPHYVYPSLDELFGVVDDLAWHQDEPFASTSIYAQWHVFRLARENGVVVMLDGQGADEQLAGYHSFFAPAWAGLFRQRRWAALWNEVRAAGRVHGYTPAFAARQVASMLLPQPVRDAARRLGARTQHAPGWLDMGVLGAVAGDPFASRGTTTDSVEALSRVQLTATNLQMLLHWEDRDSMAHSVESRVPFLDYRLVEFVLGLPAEFKISDGVTKRVLREGMKGLLPERIRTRMDKMGFVTPEEVWLREQAPDRFRQAVREAVDASGGVIRPSALARLEDVIAGRQPFDPFTWRLISFGAWMRRFGVSAAGAS
jgi:asparagine synthase (glutamine-hydrolysing)